MSWLEDSFVNGLKFEASNTLFHGSPNKKVLISILNKYYERIMAGNLSWKKIEDLMQSMFSRDYGGITNRRQSFYGNDAVCLFKYFVTKDDPQGPFVFAILSLNFSCFVTIALSYGTIVTKVRISSKETAKSHTSNSSAKVLAQLQRITIWIILTDFLCWLPFIMICCCHYLDLLDATAWYSLFSILVLPINSIVNPLIYDTSLRRLVQLPYMYVAISFNKGRTALTRSLNRMKRSKVIENPMACEHENIELQNMASIGPELALNKENQEKEDVVKVDEDVSCDKASR